MNRSAWLGLARALAVLGGLALIAWWVVPQLTPQTQYSVPELPAAPDERSSASGAELFTVAPDPARGAAQPGQRSVADSGAPRKSRQAGGQELPTILVRERASGRPADGAQVRALEFVPPGRGQRQRDMDELTERTLKDGQRSVAAADGRARVPAAKNLLFVVAWTPTSWGADILDWNHGERELALEPDGPLEVLVKDSRGAPLAGLELALTVGQVPPNRAGRQAHATSDARGLAVIEHGEAIAARFAGAECRLQAQGIWTRIPSQRLDTSRGALPVEFVSPPFGSLHLTLLDFEDRPLTQPLEVALGPQDSNPRGATASSSWSKHGELDFPCVEVGAPFRATVLLPGDIGPISTAIEIPEQGAQVEATLGGSRSIPFLCARLVDEQGAPLARQSIQVHALAPAPAGSGGLGGPHGTNDDGRVRLPLPGFASGSGGYLRLVCQPEREAELLTALVPVPLELELGDNPIWNVTLAGLPQLVAGSVVDQYGHGIQDALVSVLEMGGDFPPRWRDTTVASTTSRWGVFSIDAELDAPRIGLRASAPESLEAEVVPIAPGEAGVELVLERLGKFVSLAWIDPDISAQELNLTWVPQSSQAEGESSVTFSGRPMRSVAGESQAQFDAQALRCGSGRVEFRAVSTLVHVVEGVLIAPGASSDPRLVEVDLRGRLRAFNLTIRDHEGRDVKGGEIRFRTSASADPWEVWPFAQGRARVLATAPSLDLLVFGPPGRATHFEAVRGDRELMLAGPLWTHLRLDGPNPVSSPDHQVHVRFKPQELALLGPMPGQQGELTAVLDAAGEARFAFAAPGSYSFSFAVYSHSLRMSRGLPDEPLPVLVLELDGLQEFELACPSQALGELERILFEAERR